MNAYIEATTPEEIDYTDPANYAVEQYTSHKVTNKKGTGGFELRTRWKGFTEKDDTYEPLVHQLEDNPTILKSYINTIVGAEAEKLLAAVKRLAALLPETTVQMFEMS